MEHLKREEWTWSKFNDLLLQEFQALIVDYDHKRVLLSREEGRWIMPAYVGDEDNYESSFLPEFVKDKLWKVLGSKIDLCVLRQIWRKEMDVVKDMNGYLLEKAVVLVQFLSKREGPNEEWRVIAQKGTGKEYEWVPLANADVYHLFPDAQAAITNEVMWIMRDRVPENRLRWQRPGWMNSSTSWMRKVLVRDLGALMVKPTLVERSTPFGTIIIAKTSQGNFFLKCTPPWQNDAAYTEALARVAPKFVAAPVAVDVGKQVMITSDYGEILIPSLFNDEDKTKLTLDFVNLQQEAVGKVDELVSAGLPDFRVHGLKKKLDWLVSCRSLEAMMEWKEYQKAIDFLQNNLVKLKEKVEELYRTGVPPTVAHNDLFLSNVYKKEGCDNFMFFDWVMGYVAHPLTGVLDGLERTVYIKEWEKYANVEGLETWLTFGQRVGMLIEFIVIIQEAEGVEEADHNEKIEEAGRKLNSVMQCFSDKI